MNLWEVIEYTCRGTAEDGPFVRHPDVLQGQPLWFDDRSLHFDHPQENQFLEISRAMTGSQPRSDPPVQRSGLIEREN